MVFKIVILTLLFVVLVSLASALVAMVKGDQSDRMIKSLTWRIGLSILIFLLLLIGQAMGLITPHGLS
ncbi:MAG: twin transmembrane helix small protein [Gammaproteobacteria bacterium]|nr:twin transmembrane helix small protein [Gammaproteobacteria bacterium]